MEVPLARERSPQLEPKARERSSLNMLEKRMAFYAKLLEGGGLKLNRREAAEWRRDLPAAVEAQWDLLDRGGLPVPMTLANVRWLKTLAVSKANA